MSQHDAAFIAKHQPGPLEDVIKYLEAILVAHQEVHYSYDGSIELPVASDASIRAAIRILEAANGLSRERIEEEIDISRRQENTTMEYFFLALLVALPDGGGND